MKRNAIIFCTILAVAFVWLAGCNDNSVSDISTPQLSQADNTVTSKIMSFKKLDHSIPGTPLTTPENFTEIHPERWDGVSKLEFGKTYRMTSAQLMTFLGSDEKYKRELGDFTAWKNGHSKI